MSSTHVLRETRRCWGCCLCSGPLCCGSRCCSKPGQPLSSRQKTTKQKLRHDCRTCTFDGCRLVVCVAKHIGILIPLTIHASIVRCNFFHRLIAVDSIHSHEHCTLIPYVMKCGISVNSMTIADLNLVACEAPVTWEACWRFFYWPTNHRSITVLHVAVEA